MTTANSNAVTPQKTGASPMATLDFTSTIHREVAAMEKILVTEILNSRPKYPESLFRHYFAGYFLGVNKVPEGENLYAAWASQVGSIHTEVEVVADNDPNNILFIVPPLASTDGLNLAEAARRIPTRYNEINNRHEESARNNPILSRQQYERNISEKLQLTFSLNRTLKDHYAKWASVFNYYNVPIPHDSSSDSSTASGNTNNNISNLFDIVPGI